MEWMYVAFLGLVVAPVVLGVVGFLLLFWNKPFVVVTAAWAVGTVALLTDGISDSVKLADLGAGAVICAAWFAGQWAKKHLATLRAVPPRFGHRPF
jgi:hypothetical protein